jgi:molecular chaperone GrpE
MMRKIEIIKEFTTVMEEPQEKSAEQQPTPASNQQSESTNMNINTNNNTPSEEAARIAELEAQLAQAKQEAAENWNKYLRERAEQENFRKRQERVLADRVLHQKKALFHKLLDVMDNVERALVYQDTLDKAQLQQTLRMLHWQMNEVLRSEGLSPVATVGETFNPYIHEAIEAVESSDQPEGTIVEEARKGYTLGEETLRPARVKVSMGNNSGTNK